MDADTARPLTDTAVAAAPAIIDDTWRILSAAPAVASALGRTLDALPDIGYEAIARRARAGADIVARIDRLDVDELDAETAITLAAARTVAEGWSREAEWYWVVFDPLGEGFFSMFAPSAYSGAFVLNLVHEALDTAQLAGDDAVERHLALIADYARLVRQLTERTRGQAERGIRIPSAQLRPAIRLVEGLREIGVATLQAVSDRASGVAEAHLARIRARIDDEVGGAFDELRDLLADEGYAARAPEAVGLGSYPGGREIYDELVRIHTTQHLSASEVHERGLARMARIDAEMRQLLAQESFEGGPHDYLASLADQPRWRARTAEGIAAHFQRAIDRFDAEADRHFTTLPRAAHAVAPLPDAVSGSMTFGYYSPPQPGRQTGLYLFNVANLSEAPLPMIAALNYHELVPGHHLHLALQQERDDLHPLRRYSQSTAFAEGWAEYAARFAGEIGMYTEPAEQFGRLMMEAFLTSRLVVDTGLNALGWSLEQARAYMRDHAFMRAAEIDSETLRYACDIPGQALAYKLGDDFLHALREDLRGARGERFDIAAFHDAVLRAAGLPLPLVARQVRQDLG